MPTRFASLPTLPLHEHQLLLQVGALELLARLAQQQRQQVLLDERLVDRSVCQISASTSSSEMSASLPDINSRRTRFFSSRTLSGHG